MRRLKAVSTAVLMLAIAGAATASSALAIEGPFFRIEKARLTNASGETVLAKMQSASYVLTTSAQEIKCTSQELERSEIQGQPAKTAGLNLEIVVFKGCTVAGNGSSCEPYSEKREGTPEPGVIRTVKLKTILDYNAEKPVKGTSLLVIFKPLTGSVFVTLKFKGTACTLPEAAVEGSVGAELWNGKKELIKAEENETEEEDGYVNFPAALLSAHFIESKGTITKETASLKAFGKAATKFEGRSEVKLATSEKWGVVTK